MPSSKRRFSILGILSLVGAMTLSGCATKSFVLEEIAPVEARVAELESTTEEHAERIDAVDRRAQDGISTANSAAEAADSKADDASEEAATADRKAESAQESADQAMNRIGTVENRFGTIYDYSVAQTVTVTFDLNSSGLSDGANSTLDGIAGQVRDGDFLEVQGYTDASGEDAYNIRLSESRADAVKRYLVTKNVPLFRITVVGLGEANPSSDNDSREGREQNRRVEIRLMRSSLGQ
jgi:outer membrane protein OmpA-like peptidoglycan-associated protein